MYAEETDCPFPIYADPTRKLYDQLGMVKTLGLGTKPAYMRKSILSSSFASVLQGLKQIKNGLAMKGGDQRQVGGEFLFEPLDLMTPTDEIERQLGRSSANMAARAHAKSSATTLEGSEATPTTANGTAATATEGAVEPSESEAHSTSRPITHGLTDSAEGEDEVAESAEKKHVTWCHRMKTTRDHAEIPELMEVLGLDGSGQPIKDRKRWERAIADRKGTGLSAMSSQMSELKGQAGGT
jgi:hypothetical protein